MTSTDFHCRFFLRVACSAVACAGLMSVQAQAATFALAQGGFASQTVPGTFSGSFHAGDADTNFSSSTEQITDATLTLQFTGANTSRLVNSGPYVTGSGTDARGQFWSTTDMNYLYDDPVDAVGVSVAQGRQTATADDYGVAPFTPYRTEVVQPLAAFSSVFAAVYHTDPVVVCDFQLDQYSQGCPISHIEYQQVLHFDLMGYNRSVFITSGYEGDFTAIIDLNSAVLDTFTQTGTLQYGFDVRSGDVALTSASLAFSTAAVPEPATYALLLTGIAMLTRARKPAGRPGH